MTGFLDKLNLRPMERRLVIGVMITVFVVLNIWFVWPQFKEWNRVQEDFRKARIKLVDYQREITRRQEYENDRKRLEDEGAGSVVTEEMGLQLRKLVMNQASASGLVPDGMSDLPRTPNPTGLIEEVSTTMKFKNTGEQELVDFLYNISADRSMIRVKDLSVSPDPQLQKLQGEITLTASYQKKAPPKSAASAAPAGSKPAAAAPKTNATAGKTNAVPAKAPAPAPKSPPTRSAPGPSNVKPLPLSADVER